MSETVQDIYTRLKQYEPQPFDLRTAEIVVEEIGMETNIAESILLRNALAENLLTIDDVENTFSKDTAHILRRLDKIAELYARTPVIDTENFRDMLLSLAEDIRVIFIIIADRVNVMRNFKETAPEIQQNIAREASFLYAPLAHKLGLYLIKSELEDLSMKYLEHDAYYMIRDKLSETKRSRDAYIDNFIAPVDKKLQTTGLSYHIKGRTKSIHSIWQKMKKQKCQFENIYDLFAIRIIIDSPVDREKQDCWQVYSIVTDMYHPNPKRLRDWLSVPKSNGYECLHTTVMGPEGHWVEVQIRTERMDYIAEHGLAAHWRYKGVKAGDSQLEDSLQNLRNTLEGNGANEKLSDQYKMDLYSDEVFIFTPKGDLFKLPKGASVLDFAFQIHTKVGSTCVGALVNGKNVPVRTKLKSGDQVEILTSNNQQPKRDWLHYVITSKARNKIRQMVNIAEAKELQALQPNVTEGKNSDKTHNENTEIDQTSVVRAENFNLDILKNSKSITQNSEHDETLIIDKNVKGLDYSFARCCNPIYGDNIVGFVTLSRGITIHRTDCQNAMHMLDAMPYRKINVRWNESGGRSQIVLHVIGNDDIGIVNNMTSIILKEKDVALRSIDIKSSEDGLFSGTLTLMLGENAKLKQLIKKISEIKGVKNVTR